MVDLNTQKSSTDRFGAPSDVIRLGALVRRELRRIFYPALAMTVLILAGTFAFVTTRKTVPRAPKPVEMRLVIRRPRMQKPFEVKKRRVPKRTLAKKVGASKPVAMRTFTKAISSPNLFGTIATFDYSVGTGAEMGVTVVEPDIQPGALMSTKDPEKRISMEEEFLDIGALNTGQYKGMVIQDPTDKTNVTGFIYLAVAWGNNLQPNAPRAVPNLVAAVNRHTRIEAQVQTHLFLDSRDLIKMPFVFISSSEPFELTRKEAESLGKYMRSGGFVVADNGDPKTEYGPAEASLRKMFREALGTDARTVRLPDDHPIYHAFFDFDSGPPVGAEVNVPPGAWAVADLSDAAQTKMVPYLEGIILRDRLVAVYSDKGYSIKWAEEYENEPQLKMGVNLVVFALTQQGSIAQQQIDYYSQLSR